MTRRMRHCKNLHEHFVVLHAQPKRKFVGCLGKSYCDVNNLQDKLYRNAKT